MGRGSNGFTLSKTITVEKPRADFDLNQELIRVASEKNRMALIWAENAHRDQLRKQVPNTLNGQEVPYIIHPVSVMNVLSKAGADRDLVCAGCLHDVLEDTSVTEQQMRDEFGDNVTDLVLAVTKDRSFKGIRLEEQAPIIVEKCLNYGVDAAALKSADLLVNLGDMVWNIESNGLDAPKAIFGEKRWKRKLNHYLELSDLLQQEIKSKYPNLARGLKDRSSELQRLLNI